MKAWALVALTVVAFVVGVGVEWTGSDASIRPLEVAGVLLWTSPLALWTSIFGASSRPRPRKELRQTSWVTAVLGGLMFVIGFASLFSNEAAFVAGEVLVGVSALPIGVAIAAARSPEAVPTGPRRRKRHR